MTGDVAAADVEPSDLTMWPPPPGYRIEWVPDGEDWRPATTAENLTRECRRPRCHGAPVVALNRGWRGQVRWWLYCADHMYGRRIVGGVVQHRAAVEVDAA
jgi:hypothetical protein